MINFISSLKGLLGSNPLLSGINALSGLFNAFSSIGAGERDERRKKRLMDYEDKIADENYSKQLADQRQLIAEDRQYNSIGSQMQRARTAGISPLAALGVSSSNSIGASSPSQSAPTSPAGGIDSLTSFASSLQGAMMNMAQMQMLNKQMEKVEQETANVELQNVKQRYDNMIAEIEANGYSEKYATALETLKQELKQKATAAKISDNELQFMLDSYDDRLRGVTLSNDLTQAEKGLKDEQKEDLSKSRPSRIAQNTASAREANAMASKSEFEDWYQRNHHTSVNNGLMHVVDVVFERFFGTGADNFERTLDVFGKGGVSGWIDRGFDNFYKELSSILYYVSDQQLKEYANEIWDWMHAWVKMTQDGPNAKGKSLKDYK